MSDEDGDMITAEQIEHLDAIFDRSKPVRTREEILRLAEMVEDEVDEGIDDRADMRPVR